MEYKVERVVIEHGNIIDPLTGRRIFMDEFKDEILLKKQLINDALREEHEEEVGSSYIASPLSSCNFSRQSSQPMRRRPLLTPELYLTSHAILLLLLAG